MQSATRSIEFRGQAFRTLLQAHWAAFFEQLGTAYEYEPFKAVLLSGHYVPDIWLLELGIWVEIREKHGFFDLLRYREFVGTYRQPLIAISGPPCPGQYSIRLITSGKGADYKFDDAALAESAAEPHQLWLAEADRGIRLSCSDSPKRMGGQLQTNSAWINNAMDRAATVMSAFAL